MRCMKCECVYNFNFFNAKDLHSRKKVLNFATRLRIFEKIDIFIINKNS